MKMRIITVQSSWIFFNSHLTEKERESTISTIPLEYEDKDRIKTGNLSLKRNMMTQRSNTTFKRMHEVNKEHQNDKIIKSFGGFN